MAFEFIIFAAVLVNIHGSAIGYSAAPIASAPVVSIFAAYAPEVRAYATPAPIVTTYVAHPGPIVWRYSAPVIRASDISKLSTVNSYTNHGKPNVAKAVPPVGSAYSVQIGDEAVTLVNSAYSAPAAVSAYLATTASAYSVRVVNKAVAPVVPAYSASVVAAHGSVVPAHASVVSSYAAGAATIFMW